MTSSDILLRKLFSHSVFAGFKYYREHCNLPEFAATEPIGDMVLLLNDTFDVLNGRCIQESMNTKNFDDKTKVINFFFDKIIIIRTPRFFLAHF